MLAIFRFDVATVHCGDGPLDQAKQEDLWGRTFERLDHGARIRALVALGLIEDATRELFNQVSGTRRKYMHLLNRQRGGEEGDAREVYKKTVELSIAVLGVGLREGKLVFHPDVDRWLQRESRAGEASTS